MKRLLVLLSIVCTSAMLVFANGTNESTSSGSSGSGNGKKYTINVASTFAPEGAIHEIIVKFKENVETRSNGRIKVAIQPSGALGGEREIVEGMSNGTIEMGAQGVMDLTLYAPELMVFEEPFVIRDLDHLNKFWNTLGQEINEKAEAKTGIITATYMIRGARVITANKEIKTPADLKGLKFRLPSMPVRVKVFEAMGAIPTIVDFPEVYMALKTGTVDAQENPPETIYSYKYYEAQKYLILTNHVFSTARYQISKKWFEQQTKEDQDLLLQAWKDAGTKVRAEVPNPDAFYIEELKKKGMTIIQPDGKAFRDAAMPVMDEFDKKGQWETGLRERIMNL